MGVSKLRQQRSEHSERCKAHLWLHRHAVLESGQDSRDKGKSFAFVIVLKTHVNFEFKMEHSNLKWNINRKFTNTILILKWNINILFTNSSLNLKWNIFKSLQNIR